MNGALPDFWNRKFLLSHVKRCLAFYTGRVRDPAGGFVQNFRNDGRVFDPGRKHLVSGCRMTINFLHGARLFDDPQYDALWQHGIDAVRNAHFEVERSGYIWLLDSGGIDKTNHAYGLAFVMLMYSLAHRGGDAEALDDLDCTWKILETRFWRPGLGLYADEATADWSSTSEYLGQNANMHLCEALISAYEGTNETRYLERASRLAETITVQQAGKADGRIWEHYGSDLEIDWDYNRDDPENLYRPWGFQPGHHAEWAKLLVQLYDLRHEPWLLDRARELFTYAVQSSWDEERGGFYYGVAPDGAICDPNKYFWVHAEMLAAAALLFLRSNNRTYSDWYLKTWEYCWVNFVDHEFGGWYRVLDEDNQPVDDIKATAGAKCDYHNIGACITVLDATA